MTTPPLTDDTPRRRSALTMALARATHLLLDEPTLLADPFAFDVLGKALARQTIADPYPYNDPMLRTIRAAVVARSRFAEDRFTTAMRVGVRQLVVLGAGLDTLALRAPRDVRCIEVDRHEAQRWKAERLDEAGITIPPNVALVPADLHQIDLSTFLAGRGIEPGLPAFFSCLGVFPYLEARTALAMLEAVATYASGSEIVFDARVPRDLLSPMERWMDDMAAQSFAAAGEPWISDFDPASLQGSLAALGFASVECLSTEEINRRYFPRRRDGLQTVGGGLRLYRATVG